MSLADVRIKGCGAGLRLLEATTVNLLRNSKETAFFPTLRLLTPRHTPRRKCYNLPQSWIATFSSNKRSQLFIRTHNEPLPVVAMRVHNPDCSPFGIRKIAERYHCLKSPLCSCVSFTLRCAF